MPDSRERAQAEWNFAGRTALVTGGASGIGRAAALAFRQAQANVIVVSLETEEFRAARDSSPAAIRWIGCDLTDESQTASAFDRVDRLDYVVSCAGTIARSAEYDPEVFARVIDINLSATMRVALRARPLLSESGGGAIVNLASMLSFFGGPLVPAYSASKGGVVQLTKSLAAAWAADGIRVNAVAPGWIRTSLTRALQDDEARSAAILARTPMGRWGTPEEVASAILFLCSDAARFITGSVLTVDGGYSCS